MGTAFVDLNVGRISRVGGELFVEIMHAMGTLQPGQGLRLFATFKPTPPFSRAGDQRLHRRSEGARRR